MVRLLLALAAHAGWKVYLLDVNSAFLNGEILEEVFINQPEGYVVKGQELLVCKLNKAMYGLKQAPRAWYSKMYNISGRKASPKVRVSTIFIKRNVRMMIVC